jgi:hypothetical protein
MTFRAVTRLPVPTTRIILSQQVAFASFAAKSSSDAILVRIAPEGIAAPPPAITEDHQQSHRPTGAPNVW